MYRTATYWPPESWNQFPTAGRNVAIRVQAMWVVEGDDVEVFLQTAVAEGGYLYDGVSSAADPRTVKGARRIDLFLEHPDLRNLKVIRKAVLSRDSVVLA